MEREILRNLRPVSSPRSLISMDLFFPCNDEVVTVKLRLDDRSSLAIYFSNVEKKNIEENQNLRERENRQRSYQNRFNYMSKQNPKKKKTVFGEIVYLIIKQKENCNKTSLIQRLLLPAELVGSERSRGGGGVRLVVPSWILFFFSNVREKDEDGGEI